MDAVELLMRVEEEFAISIEDDEAEQITTPGQLCALIEAKLDFARAEERSSCATSRAFYRVRRELMAFDVERRLVTAGSSLNELLPRFHRHPQWRTLSDKLEVNLPFLVRSPFLSATPPSRFSFWRDIALWCLGQDTTQNSAVRTHSGVQTVGDLARLIAKKSGLPIQKGDVWPQLRLLIADEWNVPPDKVTRDADFVRDLGMG